MNKASHLNSLVGAALREARIVAGTELQLLAFSIGISYQRLQKYEVGKSRIPATTLRLAAEALGVPVERFFGDDVVWKLALETPPAPRAF